MRYFDLHCDTAGKCFDRNCGLYDNSLHVSLKRASKFERWAQVFAVWIDDSFRGEDAWRRFEKVSGFFLRQLSETAGAPALCTRRADLEKAEASSRNAAILSIEGAAALGGKPEHLYGAYRQGVRLVTLTWNGRCETGDGCMVPDAGGLTPFGLDVVREMERLGMVVDVSHLSKKGFRDVLLAARKPFVASHSDSKAVCDVPRNLADWQFREIAGRGGLVGLNLYRKFVGGERPGVDALLRHADHFLELGGEDVLAVGADFDGCDPIDGVGGIEDMDHVYDAMVSRFRKPIADKIFYENAHRFFLSALS
jgi:membrane dipeptidase